MDSTDQNNDDPLWMLRTFGLPLKAVLQISIVTRHMKRVTPDGFKITDESKELMRGIATEFFLSVLEEATEFNLKNNPFNKRISPEDILGAMGRLGFTEYFEVLNAYMYKLRGGVS